MVTFALIHTGIQQERSLTSYITGELYILAHVLIFVHVIIYCGIKVNSASNAVKNCKTA